MNSYLIEIHQVLSTLLLNSGMNEYLNKCCMLLIDIFSVMLIYSFVIFFVKLTWFLFKFMFKGIKKIWIRDRGEFKLHRNLFIWAESPTRRGIPKKRKNIKEVKKWLYLSIYLIFLVYGLDNLIWQMFCYWYWFLLYVLRG